MKDLRLELRFKNAILFNLIEERFRTERGPWHGCCLLAARTIGVNYTLLNGYLTLYLSPWLVGHKQRFVTQLSSSAQKIADFFMRDPEEVFPLSLYQLRIPRIAVKEMGSARFLSFQEARAQKLLPTSYEMEGAIQETSLEDAIHVALSTLTPGEAEVIRMRFGLEDGKEHTLRDMGRNFGVSRERVRQIEAKALRRLRHPRRSEKLKGFLERNS